METKDTEAEEVRKRRSRKGTTYIRKNTTSLRGNWDEKEWSETGQFFRNCPTPLSQQDTNDQGEGVESK